MKHNPDVLDMVMIQIANRTNREDIKALVSEAVTDVRQSHKGIAYIRHDTQHIRDTYTMWMQQKTTDKTMKEIYIFIADQITTITPRTVETYVRKFLKGYNPHEEIEHYADPI